MAISIDLDEVKTGSAADFRKALNDNFDKITDVVGELDGKININATQPTSMATGDMWFKLLD